jgi:hypothetical protein
MYTLCSLTIRPVDGNVYIYECIRSVSSKNAVTGRDMYAMCSLTQRREKNNIK